MTKLVREKKPNHTKGAKVDSMTLLLILRTATTEKRYVQQNTKAPKKKIAANQHC